MRIKDLCWSVGIVYDLKGLTEVSTAGREVKGVLYNDVWPNFSTESIFKVSSRLPSSFDSLRVSFRQQRLGI
jgi:hypothetical protein